MQKIQYGIRRLTLLNSGGFSRGDFPLDRSASISGSNNMGKTTAVNALQIPFLCDRREMQFAPGKSEKDTLMFYFPNSNSYVLSEVRTETGTFVVGAAGLGPVNGHEYQLFAYKKSLDIENDFLYPGGENEFNIRDLAELVSHLAQQGVWLKRLKPREMQEVLAGVRELDNNSTIGVFRLKNINNLPLFMNIFKNLLRLNDFDMEKMKIYLLNTYTPRWWRTTQNFLEKYRHFDEEVKAERAKVRSAKKISKRVQELVEVKAAWDQAYAFLGQAYQWIVMKYDDAKNALDLEISELETAFQNIDKEIDHCKTALDQLNQKRNLAAGQKAEIEKRLNHLAKEEDFFQASSGELFSRESLESRLRSLNEGVEQMIASLTMSRGQDPELIQRKVQEKEQAVKRHRALLKTIESNLIYHLSEQLKPEEIQVLLKLFNKDLFTQYIVNDGTFNIHEPDILLKKIRKVLSDCDNQVYNDGVIMVNLAAIEDEDLEKYLNRAEVEATIQDLERDQKMLEDTLKSAIDRQHEEKRRDDLKAKITSVEKQIDRHDQFLEAQKMKKVWENDLYRAAKEFEELDRQYHEMDDKKDHLVKTSVMGNQDLLKKKKELHHLVQQRTQVVLIKDFEGSFPGEQVLDSFDSWEIKDLVAEYVMKKEQAVSSQKRIYELFDLIDSDGGRRFATGNDIPARIESLKNHTEPESIAKNEALLANLRESHSVEIGAILKRFVNRLEEFKVSVRKFNRDMNKRKISNIKKLEFIIDDNNTLLNTIKKIEKKLEKQDTLFAEQGTSSMMERLIEIVENGSDLTLPNLFNLSIAGKLYTGKKFTSHGQSKIESNGTDLTIKVVLNVMLLKQILQQNPDQVLNIPAYIDEAGQIDPDNQVILIQECAEAGFVPIFASVEPQETAHYWVGLHVIDNQIQVTREDWWTIEDVTLMQEGSQVA